MFSGQTGTIFPNVTNGIKENTKKIASLANWGKVSMKLFDPFVQLSNQYVVTDFVYLEHLQIIWKRLVFRKQRAKNSFRKWAWLEN